MKRKHLVAMKKQFAALVNKMEIVGQIKGIKSLPRTELAID